MFLGRMLDILFIMFISPTPDARSDANLYAIIFAVLGLAGLITTVVQSIIFTYIGEKMTKQLRLETYRKMLKMPIPWFDKPDNSPGSIATHLSTDCHVVNGLTTFYIVIIIQATTSLIAGIIIAFIHEWRTALVALGILPFMVLVGVIQVKKNAGFN